MATKKILKYCLFSFIIFLALNFQCKKRFGCADTVYNFEIGVRAVPDLDSVNVGDTIWFEINSATQLKDVNGQLIDYSNAENLGTGISFYALDNQEGQFIIKATSKFDYLLVAGTQLRMTDDIIEYRFIEENGAYKFKLGISPKMKGIYGIIFSNAANVYRKSDACTKAAFTINFTQTDPHYYLNPNFQGGPTPVGGDYYFKIK